MKLNSILKAGVIAAVLSCAGVVSAQTIQASKSVTVNVSLTSQCRVASTSAGAITVAFNTYEAFSAAAVPATPVTVNFECTRDLTATPDFAWDGSTNEGVIAGLRYSLSATNGTLSEGAEPNLTVVGNVGTPDVRPVTIGGSMPAGQAGTSGATASATRTLTVTF